MSLFPQSAIIHFGVIILSKGNCQSAGQDADYWRTMKRKLLFVLWEQRRGFSPSPLHSSSPTAILPISIFSFQGNFPFNLLRTGSTLPYYMFYVPSSPSWRLNLLQNPFPFPISLWSSSLPQADNSPHPQEPGNPLQADPANASQALVNSPESVFCALLTLHRCRQSLKDMGGSQPVARQD